MNLPCLSKLVHDLLTASTYIIASNSAFNAGGRVLGREEKPFKGWHIKGPNMSKRSEDVETDFKITLIQSFSVSTG